MVTDLEHSSRTAEHYTPPSIVALVREIMGDIDLDPCTCGAAQRVVQATHFFVEDGLERAWHGRVYVNPPGERTGREVQRWWRKLESEISMGSVEQATWLAFNISQLRTLQHNAYNASFLEECELAVFKTRIRFSGPSPTRDQAMLYWGDRRAIFHAAVRRYGAASWKSTKET